MVWISNNDISGLTKSSIWSWTPRAPSSCSAWWQGSNKKRSSCKLMNFFCHQVWSPVDRRPPCSPCSLPRPPLQVPSKLSSSYKAETTTITIALINCNALSVGILSLDSIISLAASSPHPLVHLTLGQLFGRLNRWQKKVNQSAETIL